MLLTWFGLVLSLVLYFGLTLLPKAGAIRLLVLAGLALLFLWVAYFLNAQNFGVYDPARGPAAFLAILAITIAFVLGGGMLVLKSRLPANWPAWSWPACVLVALVAIAFPVLRAFGLG